MPDNEGCDSREKTVNGDINHKDNICRDYLRNICRRGVHCKYRHPEQGEAEALGRKIEYVFCHDYQNKECRRNNCKFIHCTREEEARYRSTGELPQRILEVVANGKSYKEDGGSSYGYQLCKDFLKGECHRLGCCKLRHINHYDHQIDRNYPWRRKRMDQRDAFNHCNDYNSLSKRHRLDDFNTNHGRINMIMIGMRQSLPMTMKWSLLEEENVQLRRKIDELKKQVSDLTATNEFLLEQNAQLRIGKQMSTLPTVNTTISMNHMTPATSVPMAMNNEMAPGPPPNPLQTQIATAPPVPPPMVPVSMSLSQSIPNTSIPQTFTMSMSGPTTSLVSYPIVAQNIRPNMTQTSLTH